MKIWSPALYTREEIAAARPAVRLLPGGHWQADCLQAVDTAPHGGIYIASYRALATWGRYPLAGSYRSI